jgi:acyl carrier protein
MAVFDQLREAIAATLHVPEDSMTPDTRAVDLAAWDSFGHVNLMMTLEQTFELMLDVEDFQRLNSIAAIIEYLGEQGISD